MSTIDSIIPSLTAFQGAPALSWSSRLKFPFLNSLYNLFTVDEDTLLMGKAVHKL